MSEKTFYTFINFASRWMNRKFQKFTIIEIINIHYTASFEQLIGWISPVFGEDNSQHFLLQQKYVLQFTFPRATVY